MVEVNVPLLVGAGFGAAGLGALGYGFWNLARAVDSETWPTVDGEIIESRIAEDFGRSGRLYYAAVRYRYTAGGVPHDGDRIAFGGPLETSWRGPAERTAARYPKGKTVRVHVSPNDPTLSVLEVGANWYVYAVLLFGALFLAFGIRDIINALG